MQRKSLSTVNVWEDNTFCLQIRDGKHLKNAALSANPYCRSCRSMWIVSCCVLCWTLMFGEERHVFWVEQLCLGPDNLTGRWHQHFIDSQLHPYVCSLSSLSQTFLQLSVCHILYPILAVAFKSWTFSICKTQLLIFFPVLLLLQCFGWNIFILMKMPRGIRQIWVLCGAKRSDYALVTPTTSKSSMSQQESKKL